jgi:leucine dehydrogenase
MTAVFDHPAFDDHEQVCAVRDRASGMTALIAVHSTALGPGAGGVRMHAYADAEQALRDVLRLSRGMSFKNALAGLSLGGGKAVLIGDPRRDKTEARLRALGRAIDGLGGRYLAAEDVGMTLADMETIALETPHVFGRDPKAGFGGEPSPMTALGVFLALEVCARRALGKDDLNGVRVAVQGAGAVGADLCRRLGQAGAAVIVADVDAERAARAAAACGGLVAPADAILTAEADMLAPCAMGAVLTDETIAALRVKAVCGAANNQLAEPRHADALAARGILYAPDYVANAGGIINVAHEVAGGYDAAKVEAHVRRIAGTLEGVFEEAAREGLTPAAIADAQALRRIGR